MRAYVLTIAGFDPSAGAGLLADVKTFEQYKRYGLSICTAVTVQNDITFQATNWVDQDQIAAQIKVLKERFKINFLKIGLIENWAILKLILTAFPDATIVFDPILKASAGFEFHTNMELETFYQLLQQVDLITPNREEIMQLAPASTPEASAVALSMHCPVLLKGGHHAERLGEDELWQTGTKTATFHPEIIANTGKHGSGCVLSAAILAELTHGKSLIESCTGAKTYTEHFLNSNTTLLGYHNIDTKKH